MWPYNALTVWFMILRAGLFGLFSYIVLIGNIFFVLKMYVRSLLWNVLFDLDIGYVPIDVKNLLFA